MEGPRNCYECTHGKESKVCPACGATGGLAGKVWPSVEAEQVRVVRANGIVGVSLTVTASFDVRSDGEYLIICQPLKEGEVKP